MRWIIGIDPGLDGGLAAISPEGLHLAAMPTAAVGKHRQIDEQAIVSWLLAHHPAVVFIEHVGARPGQGVVSMFTFGTGWGLVRGICAGMALPYEMVRPQEWQGKMLAGQPKGAEYLVASRLWPSADWKASDRAQKAHEGMVDAALIAEYGRRQLGC
ncbi:MAG TPA: hypothetical protein PK280_17535 [Planctomycetota bacterium]|nr:hypothetical protein [Planctomycetota bacterium]